MSFINSFLNLKISSIELVAEDVLTIELEPIDDNLLPNYKPGSHIDIHISSNLIRKYSICTKDLSQEKYRLAILREQNSKGGSAKIFKDFKLNQIIKTSMPICNFNLESSDKKSYLFAGGIGITPILSMAYALDYKGANFELYYFCRSKGKAAFYKEIVDSKFSNNTYVYFDSDTKGIRFQKEKLLQGLAVDTHIYICGPTGFMDFIKTQAIDCGYSSSQIHTEYFKSNVEKNGASFKVYAKKSGLSIDVLENQTIAQALHSIGIKVELSCEHGVCGTCLTPVLEGIPEHRDLYQTEEEKEKNLFITPCCSRARTNSLVLNI